jgi:hypothetical protein
MCFSSPSAPAAVPAPAPAPSLPDQGVQNAGQNQRNLAAMAYGSSQTILTGPMGLQNKADTTASGKTLLGA